MARGDELRIMHSRELQLGETHSLTWDLAVLEALGADSAALVVLAADSLISTMMILAVALSNNSLPPAISVAVVRALLSKRKCTLTLTAIKLRGLKKL